MKNVIFSSLFLILSLVGSAQLSKESVLELKAPEVFQAVFSTTKGDFTIEVTRDWSPKGADRLYQLVKSGYYDNNCIFRVQKEYVVQFGIGNNKYINDFWDKRPLSDEPAKVLNLGWTVSFAREGANSRTTHLFINKKDNPKLDTITYNGARGFTPVAKVISGFETIEQLFGEYGFEPTNHQDSAMVQGNDYWRRKFEGLDYIVGARVVEESYK